MIAEAASHVMPSDELMSRQAHLLSAQLRALRERLFPPEAQKTLRRFTSGEAAKILHVSDGYLRQLSLDGLGPRPETVANGRRLYSLAEINELRVLLANLRPKEALEFLPHRREGDALQVIAVANFKGGSAKTTTSLYLAQSLALRGYRVLAVDLDPQASLSSMFGVQPEFDIGENQTLYGAIRYDDQRVELADIVRKTYFSGLDIVPANLELMEFEHETPRAILEKNMRGDELFFRRIGRAIHSIGDQYDVVVIDCPPQMGYLTLGALCAATGIIITIHPQMVDVASMSQFLLMSSELMSVVRNAGANPTHDFIRYAITRHDPRDGPECQVVALLRGLFESNVLTATAWKSTAIANAGLTKQTLYELERGAVGRATYDRAIESIEAVNSEIEQLMRQAWGRNK